MKILNYINGQFQAPLLDKWLDNVNPATGNVYGKIPDSTPEDVELAAAAAHRAFPGWKAMGVEKRSRILQQIAERIEERMPELAMAETNDNGKPLWLSKQVDIPRAASNFRFFASGIVHFASESHASDQVAINYTLRQPLGVVACISPWNLPLYLFTWKIAPALAAGNCVLAKPSEVTPATAYLLSEICMEVGLPPGVLNIIHGTGPETGAAMVNHPLVKAVSFTGSTRAGAEIARIAAPQFKKLSLELGGKNPNIIFADCDWDKMLSTTIQSSFSNQGQICLCGSRILIERSIYEDFKTAFIAKTAALKVGDPLSDEVRIGAIVSRVHYEKIQACIKRAVEEGGKILFGGKSLHMEGRCAEGFFIEPTIIEGLGPSCQTNQEEIFGPVVTLQPFDTEEEALALANDSSYGLAATLWTSQLSRAHRMSAQLESGIVWVNCWLLRDLRTPFGGVKQSGVGREGGWEALRFFTEPKNVCIQF